MSTPLKSNPASPRGLVLAAFATIYLVWGSTYLGIRFAVETIPPFLMGAGRFLIAGVLLYAWLRLTGTPDPGAQHWRNAAVVGGLLLGVGNGLVNWSEQSVPSGVASLLIAMTPLWFALLDWLRPHGTRPGFQTVLGILIGFAGVVMLVGSRENLRHQAIDPLGVGALLVASVAWASGSLYARYTPKPESALMAVALQMMTGGTILLVTGVLLAEGSALNWSKVSTRSAIAFLYLTVIGSLVAFTAYSWLLKHSTPARISTYAYVNPVIAVFLGWAFAGETLTPRMIGAAAVIVLGVIIITSRRVSMPPQPTNEAPDSLAQADARSP
ncbi:MAG: drug/metabolite exporter YedA [Verrucomicrobia bacterium]|nr:drug/metabolite exporter YedA [Verrucomicrobiota bacterium]